MIYIIDNGHGRETRGKRSPDSRLLEWSYTRSIARDVAAALPNSVLLVPEDEDAPLRIRAARANAIAAKAPRGGCCLVSIHCNAAGRGDAWMGARGWSAFVSPNASAASIRLAAMLHDAAAAEGLATRRPAPGLKHWTQNLAICRDTICPAVLTENLFMDNPHDLDLLLSHAGRHAIVNLHINALKRFANE